VLQVDDLDKSDGTGEPKAPFTQVPPAKLPTSFTGNLKRKISDILEVSDSEPDSEYECLGVTSDLSELDNSNSMEVDEPLASASTAMYINSKPEPKPKLMSLLKPQKAPRTTTSVRFRKLYHFHTT